MGYRGNTTLATSAKDVTTTAAEVSKLAGAPASVTAANLGTLTAGPTSNADAMHQHAQYDLHFPIVEKAADAALEFGKNNYVRPSPHALPTITAGDIGKLLRITSREDGFSAWAATGQTIRNAQDLPIGNGMVSCGCVTLQVISTSQWYVVSWTGSISTFSGE